MTYTKLQEQIYEILDTKLEAYADQEAGCIRESSVKAAVEDIDQLICNTLVDYTHKIGNLILSQKGTTVEQLLKENGFSDVQIGDAYKELYKI